MTSDPGQPGPAGWVPPSGPTEPAPFDSASPWARPGGQSPPADGESTMRLPRMPDLVGPDVELDRDGPAQRDTPVRREGLRGTLVVLGLTVLVLIGVAALGLSSRAAVRPITAALPPPTLSPTRPGPTAPRATPAGAAVYQLPGDLCEAADFTDLRPTFDQIGDLAPHQDSTAGFFQFAQCDGTTGNDTVQGNFSFRASVYADPQVARQEFEAARSAVASHGKVASIAGVGSQAYDYVDPAVGPTVEIYDGNLRIRLSWGAADGKAKAPAGTAKALIDVCESTMMLLRDN